MTATPLSAQSAAPAAKSPAPNVKKPDKSAAAGKENAPMNKLFGPDAAKSNEPITTEIYADEAFFDSSKSMGVFSGHVKVTDPRFNLQSDKLTVFISKGENPGTGESDRGRERGDGARPPRSEWRTADTRGRAFGESNLHRGDRRCAVNGDAARATGIEHARGDESGHGDGD